MNGSGTIWTSVLEQFERHAPASVMARVALEHALPSEWIDVVFEEHRQRQYSHWTCPALTDTPDRLNGLRGVDGGEQQTAPVVSGRVQARGGGRSPRWPLGFGGGGRAWPAGPAGTGFGALGGGPPSGRGGGARGGAPPAPRGARAP